MLREIKARKNKSLASNILENMTTAVSLSDRLKQAGIRECEPDCGTKIGNLSQNRKNQPKKGLAEKRSERHKKLQNLYEFYSPYFKDCYQNKTPREKNLSKNYMNFSKTLRRKIRGSAKRTIFASLDFIKDCQKYKKKVRNPEKHSALKSKKKSESDFGNPKQDLYIKSEAKKLHGSKTYSQISFCNSVKKKEDTLNLDVWEDKKAENSCVRKDPLLFDQNTEKVNMKEQSIKNERKSQSNTKFSETLLQIKPFCDEFPTGDVARIDKKYLQTLLSITNTKDKRCTDEEETENNQEVIREKHGRRKGKKKSSEIIPESKLRTKKSEERKGAAEEMQKDSEITQKPSHEKSVLAKIVRDSTKSEAQIFVQTNKFYNQRSSEMKSEKNMAHTKPEISNTRKNRKNRNKLLRNKNEEFSDSIFPYEIPKVVDVKELWRRDIREKSENSLSSNSSSTVPKSDADPDQKNLELESYKVLKKFVEEEVKKMSNESEKKNNLKEIENTECNFKTNEFKSVDMKESEKVENICRKLKIAMAENLNDEIEIIKNEMCSLKKKLAQTEHTKRYSIYEGEKINSTLLSSLTEDKLKDEKGDIKLLKEKGKINEKTPSQIINNWSILNRLEQAFLALGTPNFQDKNIKNSKPLKGQELIRKEKISVNASKKGQNHLEKIGKESQKTKEVEGQKGNRDASNALHFTFKTATQSFRNKKPEDNGQQNLIKNNQQISKFKKESTNDGSQNNALVKITEKKKIAALKEKKKTSNQTTHENAKKKSTVRSLAKAKTTAHEPRQSGRKQNKKSSSRSSMQAKKNESCQKKLPKLLVQNKSSGETLKKKKFDIIQKKELSTVQPQESKSCDKTDDNFQLEDVKICFSQTKNQELKENESYHKNTKDKPQSVDKDMKNETQTKIKSFIPKKSAKVPIRKKPMIRKNNEMKEYLKVFLESSVKIPDDKTEQEKPGENEKEIKEFPTKIQEKKLINNSSERVIKERSILSMSGKQQNPQESITKLMQIEGKYPSPPVSNLESSEIEKFENGLRNFFELSTVSTQQINRSTTSNLNISDLKLIDSNSNSDNQKKMDINSRRSSMVELSKKLTPFSDFSNNDSISTQASEVETEETEQNVPRCQTKQLWEQDVRHYCAIVKEIMSHYNRINGFLTQSDYLQSFSTDSTDLISMKNSTDEDSTLNKSQKMNLHEYRKKIMSEYQALPIFEYKKLFQEKKEENLLTKEATKRNLTVVKDVTTEMDLDVKDFQPKIQKILDSQLYVDVENLNKRNHLNFKEKKSSLQEIVRDKNEKKVNQEHLRASSTIKTFSPLPSSSACVESLQEDLTETISSTSIEETESDYL